MSRVITPDERPIIAELGEVVLQIHKAITDPRLTSTLPGLRKRSVDLKMRLGIAFAPASEVTELINRNATEMAAEQSRQDQEQQQQQQRAANMTG